MEKLYNIEDANTGKIEQIARHFLISNLSLRNFCDMYCSFSHVTLRDKFLNILPFINDQLYKEIKNRLEFKRAKKVTEDNEAKIRVLKAIKLLIEKNLTVSQIAEELNTTEMTIYRDLTRRIDMIDEINSNLKKQILLRLQEHKNNNLNKGVKIWKR